MTTYQYFDRFEDDQGIIVPQHLEPEQVSYEFPSRSTLEHLATFLNDNDDSMFDESPIGSTTYSDDEDSGLAGDDQFDSFIGSIVSAYTNEQRQRCTNNHMAKNAPGYGHKIQQERTNHHNQFINNKPVSMSADNDDEYLVDDDEDDDDMEMLVDDSRLSPLQIPPVARCVSSSSFNSSYSLYSMQRDNGVVAPCSFLCHEDLVFPNNRTCVSPYHGMLGAEDHHQHLDLPVFRNESEPIMDDDDSNPDTPAKTITLKLRKSVDHCYRRPTCPISDEGYADDDQEDDDNVDVSGDYSDNEPPLESEMVFLPLSAEEQQHMVEEDVLRNTAATRIQAVWRGYHAKKQLAASSSTLSSSHRLIVDLARICNAMHQKQMNAMHHRMDELEQQLEEERAMRIAFEKAVEDMTIMVDQQQNMLYDRLEQQRMEYEAKVAKMETRLRKETKARMEMEQSMTHVVKQVQDMHTAQQRRAKEDAEHQKNLQRKLNDALYEINQLKASSTTTTNTTSSTSSSRTTSAPRTRRTIVPNASGASSVKASTVRQQQQQQPRSSIAPRSSHQSSTKATPRLSSRPSITPRPSSALRTSQHKKTTTLSTNKRTTTTTTTTVRNSTLPR
ncbi:hypothetical protein K492DRAFT_55704 [Lichtheimia hyalospora FSU 10163]|nr:hypothetical protein K492DRAFT_55704 [Lichtheimia hyalospora FSU 10163]